MAEDKKRLEWEKKDSDKALARAKEAEELALEKARKANEVIEGLRKEVDAEKASSVAVLTENDR